MYLGRKNLNDQARLNRFKTVNFKAMLQAIVNSLVISNWRVSGEFGISQPVWFVNFRTMIFQLQ